MVEGEGWFADRPWLCELVACVCQTSCFCSVLTIGAIAFNRYIYICKEHLYGKIYTVRKTLAMCISLWVLSFVAKVINLLGWGGHGYDRKSLLCNWDRLADLSYTVIMLTVSLLFFALLTSLLYGQIYRFVQKSQPTIRLLLEAGNVANVRKDGEIQRQIRRQTVMFFTCFMAFIVCMLPYAFLVALDFKDVAPLPVHLYFALLTHINSSINCIIYGIMNSSFRNAYLHLLGFGQSELVHSDETKNLAGPRSEYKPITVSSKI